MNDLLEKLAAAETEYRKAQKVNEDAWLAYDQACDWRACEMLTRDDLEKSASYAEGCAEYASYCYEVVNALKAEMLQETTK